MDGNASTKPSLSISEIVFRFRRWSDPVINGVSTTFTPGLTVLLGPNGAGKTTLLRSVATLNRPTSGTIVYSDGAGEVDSRARSYCNLVGYMPQDPEAVRGLNAREHLLYCAWLAGFGGGEAVERVTDWIVRVGLDAQADTATTALSGGMKRRLAIAAAAIAEPPILLLDEPSVGLDPAQRARFREVLTRIKGDRIVLMSTHQVDDLLGLVDAVAVMSRGRIVFHDTFDALLAHTTAQGDLVYRVEAAYTHLLGGRAA